MLENSNNTESEATISNFSNMDLCSDYYLDYDDIYVEQRPKTKRKNTKIVLVENNHYQALKYLLKNDVDRLDKYLDENSVINESMDEDFNTLLHIAAKRGNCVRFLLERKADMFSRNKQGKTPYDVCKNQRCKDVFMEFGKNRKFTDFLYKEAHMPTMEEIREKQYAKEYEEYKRTVRQQRRLSSYYRNKERVRQLTMINVIADKKNKAWRNCEVCQCKVGGAYPYECLGRIFCSEDCFKTYKLKN